MQRNGEKKRDRERGGEGQKNYVRFSSATSRGENDFAVESLLGCGRRGHILYIILEITIFTQHLMFILCKNSFISLFFL